MVVWIRICFGVEMGLGEGMFRISCKKVIPSSFSSFLGSSFTWVVKVIPDVCLDSSSSSLLISSSSTCLASSSSV